MLAIIIDDVEINNILIAESLRGVDCEAVAFTDAAKALDFARSRADAVGVVVTDFDMPGLNGLDFVQAARQIEGLRHVPIIMVTSHAERQLRRSALLAGATDFLAKPFDPVEVKTRVTNLLALRKAMRMEEDRGIILAREVAAAVSTVEARETEIVSRLVRAAEHRDTDTGDHVSRVAKHVAGIARALGFDEAAVNRLRLASTMHDIGKIAVRDAVLLKPGPLTPQERVEMSEHATAGFEILEGSSSDVVKLAAEIALSHHERWDGQGYPSGLAGENIPLPGRIVAVADVFDALVSDRPYKKAWSVDEALKYLRDNAGAQFDPVCVEAFLNGVALGDRSTLDRSAA